MIDFWTKYIVENAENSISKPLDFKISEGACLQNPTEARAFGAPISYPK